MGNSVLILDDDADFNSLLTDIFEQADYIVSSLEDPTEAIEVFRNTEYDLVVTDFRMPEMSGIEFMKAIKKIKPEVPIIMVSGYLENDTIRELISEGVGGVFLKPLNIFSLLERTSELIAEAKRASESADGAQENRESTASRTGEFSRPGFDFRSFPCKSKASAGFAERLYSLRNFKSTLSLIGAKGTHYRMICEDICGFYDDPREGFIYLSPSTFDSEQVFSMIDAAQKAGARRVTCVLLDVESMSADQKCLASALARCEGEFEAIDIALRTIFTVSGDLDTLFDEGVIDEHLYILMGTAEVPVPSLNECPEDLSIMAQHMVADIIGGKGKNVMPQFEKAAREFIETYPWERNYAELSEVVHKVVEAHPGDVFTLSALNAAVKAVQGESPRGRFEGYLSNARLEMIRAISALSQGEHSKVAAFLGTDTGKIETVLK